MADEELDLDLSTPEEERINKVEKRIKDLSEKVKLTATERDDLVKAKDLVEAEKQAALKDVDFYKNFSAISSKYQGANEYQDKIREKTALGLDVEEATLLVMTKEGKYIPPTLPVVEIKKESPIGGSAVNTFKPGEKSVAEMSLEEKRAQLVEAEKRGDITLT